MPMTSTDDRFQRDPEADVSADGEAGTVERQVRAGVGAVSFMGCAS